MTAIRVSVVIPAFDAAWSIGDTLRSVCAQTLDDFECLIIDDGSTEDLAPNLAPHLTGDPRLRVIRQENMGLAATRNRGLGETRAPYIAFLDSDDMWHPDFLARAVAVLESNPKAPFAYAYSRRIDAENMQLPTPRWSSPPRHDLIGLLEVNSVANGSAALFRRSAVTLAKGFDVTLQTRAARGAEDWKLSLTLAAIHAPVLIPEQLVAYRITERSMSRSRPDRQLHSISAVMDDLRAAHPEIPERHFRNARTVMNGWLFPAYLARRAWGGALRLLWESYILNPLWFLSRDVRAIHMLKLWSIVDGSKRRELLAEVIEGSTRPFAFLDSTAVARSTADASPTTGRGHDTFESRTAADIEPDSINPHVDGSRPVLLPKADRNRMRPRSKVQSVNVEDDRARTPGVGKVYPVGQTVSVETKPPGGLGDTDAEMHGLGPLGPNRKPN